MRISVAGERLIAFANHVTDISNFSSQRPKAQTREDAGSGAEPQATALLNPNVQFDSTRPTLAHRALSDPDPIVAIRRQHIVEE